MQKKNKLFSSLPVVLALVLTGTTTVLGASKIYSELSTHSPDSPNIVRNTDEIPSPEELSAPTSNQDNVEAQTVSVSPDSYTFDSNSLANHNSTGDCYIAYSGNVYDVSNQPSWSGCTHHGARGGVDITSIFPHPTSYLSTIPMIGSYTPSGYNHSNSVSNSNKQTDFDKEEDIEHEAYELDDDGLEFDYYDD